MSDPPARLGDPRRRGPLLLHSIAPFPSLLFRRSLSLSVLRVSGAPHCAVVYRNKLVTPLTNPQFINRMKEMETKFSSMKSEMFGVAPTVEPIDWKFWGPRQHDARRNSRSSSTSSNDEGVSLTERSTSVVSIFLSSVLCCVRPEEHITDKALVASLRKEYESLKFEAGKGEDLTKINADLDFAIQKASGAAAISREELPKLQAQLAAAIKEKKDVHNWTPEDYFRAYPGLEQQLRDEYMQGEFLPSEAEERLEAQDVNEARKQFKSGAEITVPDDLPDRIGDFSIKAEQAKVDELLTRMFGGSKSFEAARAAEKAAEAKKAAAHHHH